MERGNTVAILSKNLHEKHTGISFRAFAPLLHPVAIALSKYARGTH
jgi:hypothetical protein